VRLAVGNPGRSARLAALEPVEAATTGRRRESPAHRCRPLGGAFRRYRRRHRPRRPAVVGAGRAAGTSGRGARSRRRALLRRQSARRPAAVRIPRFRRVVHERARIRRARRRVCCVCSSSAWRAIRNAR
jgi:hypothetical protein